jgi:toxin ParE1/3/4
VPVSLPVIPRRRASQDIDRILAGILADADAAIGRRFVDALEEAFAHIAQFPASGSTRYALALQLPGLRTWRVAPFPYLIFYYERSSAVDVWAVLHERRDLPASLADAMTEQ